MWRARQLHTLPPQSHQHGFLVDLWEAVRRETGGRLVVSVHPHNGGMTGGAPLDMLVRGELEFFTLMGNALGRLVPVAELQGVPYAFASEAQVHAANDGTVGELIGRECAAKGIHRFRYGLLENGFRQIATFANPIRTADDLRGLRIRVPDAAMIRDVFASLGAEPVTIDMGDLAEAVRQRRVDGHENPLIVFEVTKLHAVTRCISLTRHMWTGFNLLASLAFWKGLPEDVQEVVERNVRTFVAAQRAHTQQRNRELGRTFAERGATVVVADRASFRRALGDAFYRRWKERLGSSAWSVLEAEVGRLV
jgi:tripartite ATP-independent transporter DctP family solute receptor